MAPTKKMTVHTLFYQVIIRCSQLPCAHVACGVYLIAELFHQSFAVTVISTFSPGTVSDREKANISSKQSNN